MKEIKTLTHISRISHIDLEEMLDDALLETHGERFSAYRKEYRLSLDADRTGDVPARPITVGLELLNKCNFKCVMCITPQSTDPKIVITQDTVDRVLNECKTLGIPALMFGMGEEPLLHKGFLDILAQSKAAGIMDIFLFTNGLLVNDRIAQGLVDTPISRVYFSLDAATPETFEKIRGSNQLEKIEENIMRLLKIREATNSKLPIMRVSFCVQEGNKHERAMFGEKWANVVDHVDFQELHDFSDVFKMSEMPEEDRFRASEPRTTDTRCQQPWEKLTIWANGEVSPCCSFHGKNLIVGNIHQDTIEEIWNNEKINEIRSQLSSDKLNPVCEVCLRKRSD